MASILDWGNMCILMSKYSEILVKTKTTISIFLYTDKVNSSVKFSSSFNPSFVSCH